MKLAMTSSVLFASLMTLAGTVSAQTTPTTGQIQLVGRISDSTCTVQINGQNPDNAVVGMGTYPKSAFSKAGDTAGGSGGMGQILFMLSDCPGGPIEISFSGTEVAGYSDAIELDSPNDANTAKNVGVHLYSQALDPFTPLNIGRTYTLTPQIEQNNIMLHFVAKYVATANDVQPGLANATVGYSIVYN